MIHLHNHNIGSLLDGKSKSIELVNRCKELGMDSISLTNHGNMVTLLDFYKTCKENQVKPIIGTEFYLGESGTTDVFHLVLLAKNITGFNNLLFLNYFSHMQNFYSKPRINLEMLKKHSEGLICLSACLGSEIGQLFEKDKLKEAEEKAKELKDIFKEDFYLEMQSNDIERQKIYNHFMIDLSNNLSVELIVTCDSHYATREEANTHDTFLCMQIKKKKDDLKRFRFTGDKFYLQSEEEIKENLSYLPDGYLKKAIKNTHKIADKCNVSLEPIKPQLPIFSDNSVIKLAELCNVGFKKRLEEKAFEGLDLNVVIKRIQQELKDYTEKGYADYFLITWDFLNYCKENNIFYGPGRGSVAGSEIAFILGFTEAEPIRYGLLSERFLNPTRVSTPDIDSDICFEDRQKVIQYLKEKYGKHNVCTVLAEGKMTLASCVRKILSVYNYDTRVINSVAKILKQKVKIKDNFRECQSIEEALIYLEDFNSFFNTQPEEILKDIISLEGSISHFGKHAAGLVIYPNPVYTYIPVMRDSEDKEMMMAQLNKKDIEFFGGVKFDLLGLKLLTIFKKTLKQIKDNHNITITREDLFKINLEDANLYNLINSLDLLGIFQLSGESAKETIKKIKPQTFEDVVVATSICRPGVKDADLYLSNRKIFLETGTFPVPSYWEHVKDILEPTLGAIVYQEQTMLLFNKLANFTLGEADSLRKVKSLEPYREKFVNGCISRGMTLEEATDLFNRFDLSYSFNKSHAVVYSLNSMVCAYLKHYYRAEFIASCLTLELLAQEPQTNAFISEAKKYSIKTIGADINKSTLDYIAINSNTITMPFTSIDKLGSKVAEKIIENKPYSSLLDFTSRVYGRDCNKTITKNLIKAGAFDTFNSNRLELLNSYEEQPETIFTDEILMRYEKESLGFTLSKHPLDNYQNNSLEDFEEIVFINAIITEVKETKDKRNNKMCFIKAENQKCSFSGIVFSYVYKKIANNIFKDALVQIEGKKDGNSVLINNIKLL